MLNMSWEEYDEWVRAFRIAQDYIDRGYIISSPKVIDRRDRKNVEPYTPVKVTPKKKTEEATVLGDPADKKQEAQPQKKKTEEVTVSRDLDEKKKVPPQKKPVVQVSNEEFTRLKKLEEDKRTLEFTAAQSAASDMNIQQQVAQSYATSVVTPFVNNDTPKPTNARDIFRDIINNGAKNTEQFQVQQTVVNQVALDRNTVFSINAQIDSIQRLEDKYTYIRSCIENGCPNIQGLDTDIKEKINALYSIATTLETDPKRDVYDLELNSLLIVLTNRAVIKQIKDLGAVTSDSDKLFTEVESDKYAELVAKGFKWFFEVKHKDPNKFILIAINPVPKLSEYLNHKTGLTSYGWNVLKSIDVYNRK